MFVKGLGFQQKELKGLFTQIKVFQIIITQQHWDDVLWKD